MDTIRSDNLGICLRPEGDEEKYEHICGLIVRLDGTISPNVLTATCYTIGCQACNFYTGQIYVVKNKERAMEILRKEIEKDKKEKRDV